MQTRLYKPEDYAVIEPWFAGHQTAAVGEAMLPKCGVVAYDETGLLAVGWLYQDNSVGVAWLAWLTSNPDLYALKAAKALQAVLGGAEAVCRDLHYGLLFSMTNKASLVRWLKRQGFEQNHDGATQLFKIID